MSLSAKHGHGLDKVQYQWLIGNTKILDLTCFGYYISKTLSASFLIVICNRSLINRKNFGDNKGKQSIIKLSSSGANANQIKISLLIILSYISDYSFD